MKNIGCNNEGDVHLFTIASSIIVPMLLASLQKNLKKVFNLHIKPDCPITHKVSLILIFKIVF